MISFLPFTETSSTAPDRAEEEEGSGAGAKEEEYKPLLDSEYNQEKKDATFGDEYNTNMLKELERGTPEVVLAKKEK